VLVGKCGGCLTCEELVGVTHRRWWGWSCRFVNSHVYTLWNIWFY